MRKCWMVAAVVIVSITACSDARRTTAGPPAAPGRTAPSRIALVSFDACGDYLSWVRQAALTQVGPYGLEGVPRYAYDFAEPGVESSPLLRTEDAGIATPTASAAAQPGAPAENGTNLQEAGVDEGDQTKVDGSRIVTVHGTTLEVVSIAGSGPTLVSSTDVGLYNGQLLVDGDRAIVYGPSNEATSTAAPPMPAGPTGYSGTSAVTQRTDLVQVDLSKGTVVDRRTVDGTVTAARAVDGTFRLVVSSVEPQGLGFVMPQNSGGDANATAFNKAVIERSTISDWLPSMTDAAGHRSALVDCASMSHPAAFSGFDTLTILTVPGGLDTMTATGLAADAEVTYASPTHLYVATTSGPTRSNTDIHQFDISTKDGATYQGSGRIDGEVLNQYSMSEAGAFLRVATTDAGAASSGITVLTMKGAELTKVGAVGGLGPSEQIKAVRYLGDLAYVVTFRRTDPLHVVDLSVPTTPRVLGELTADGFSSYLLPVGANRLLGIGSDADPSSGRPSGGLVSLYDTSDPTHPRELDRITFPFVQFAVSQDPHALTWDETTQVATATGQTWATVDGRPALPGVAIGISVAGDHLREVGRIVEPGGSDAGVGVSRTLVAGDRLWSITWTGVSGHDRATLAAVTPALRW
jgi:hypothetical protein